MKVVLFANDESQIRELGAIELEGKLDLQEI